MTLVDGHNLYFALDRVDENDFEGGLNQLIDSLRVKCRRGKTMLVLDGSGGADPRGSERSLSEHLRLVQSGHISADEWIENWLSRQGASGVTLVTGDLKLFRRISSKGLKRVDPVDWYIKLRKQGATKATPTSSSSAPDKPTSVGSVEDWLDYFGEET